MKKNLIILFITLASNLFAQEKSMIKGINRVGLSVKNLHESVAFYSNGMQLKEIKRDVEKKGILTKKNHKFSILQGPNCFLELMQFAGSESQDLSKMPIEGPGITHVCYQASKTKPIYEKVKTLSAKIISRGNQPIDRGFGYTYAYARDLNNIMFEMEHLEKPTFKEDVIVGHVALVTPDMDRLVKFYTQILGIEPHTRRDSIRDSPKLDDIANIDGLKMRAAWFKTGSIGLEMWSFENPKTLEAQKPSPYHQIGYNKVVFEVENIDSEYKRLKDLGVKFLSEPVSNKNYSVVYARDPDGNLIGLEQHNTDSTMSLDRLKFKN
jgi:catechol 2,3-dioxygenase-like lactoylglutathione lyase family enzyme